MSFKTDDVITFEDGSKRLVITALVENGSEYLYVCGINNEETEINDKYEVLEADYNDGTLNLVSDIELLNVLLPKFYAKIKDMDEE